MATLYRQSFDQFPVDQRYSLGLAVALEYKAGLELNPWHDRVRGYFADFLEQNPEYQRAIVARCKKLFRENGQNPRSDGRSEYACHTTYHAVDNQIGK